METVKSYRDLRVWQMAMEITSVVYDIARRLPAEKTYALAGQLRRAAVSLAANIAEGQAREHTKEFLRYLSVARGSLAEVDTLLEVALRADYVGSEEVQSVRGSGASPAVAACTKRSPAGSPPPRPTHHLPLTTAVPRP